MVVAKGARLLAERIKQVAREHRVPLYEDPPLAASLFAVPVNTDLPFTLYHAVAQVLAFVYHSNRREKEMEVLRSVNVRRMREAVSPGG